MRLDDETRLVIFGGLGLLLFLIVFAMGQFVEIFRATSGYAP